MRGKPALIGENMATAYPKPKEARAFGDSTNLVLRNKLGSPRYLEPLVHSSTVLLL